MTTIGSSYLLSSLTQLRTANATESNADTTLSKALVESQDISLNGSSVLLLRQNLNDVADLIAKVEVSNLVLDGIASRLVALEDLEVQQSQYTQSDTQYVALSNQISDAQIELTDYVVKNSAAPGEWKIISDQSPGVDNYFDFETWAYSVDEDLYTKIATLEMKADDLLAKFHVPDNCYLCNSGEVDFKAAPTTTTTTQVGAQNDATTTNANWDSLRSGALWSITGSANLSYSYFSGVPYADPYNGRVGGPEGTTTAFNATQQADHDAVMRAWDDVVDFEFEKIVETDASNVGELRIAYTSAGPQGSAAFAYLPFNSPVGGDIWYMATVSSNDSFAAGTYGMVTAIHEVGHAIGLKHPFETDQGEGPILAANLDNARNTVMTYNQTDRNMIWNISATAGGVSAQQVKVNPITPMLYDVAFAQENYGTETSVRNTNTTYNFATAPEVFQTIVDGGGNDTIDLTGLARGSIINLDPGSFSSIGYTTIADQLAAAKTANPGFDSYFDTLYGAGYTTRLYQWDDNVAIAYNTTIENAIGGSGADTITGNSANNEIWGKGGNDTINGGAGENTAGYTGAYADYTITDNNGVRTVAHNNNGADGTDTVSNVRFLKFSDLTFDVTTSTTSATTSGAPSGVGQNASSTSAAGATNAANAATSSKVAGIVLNNTPAPNVAITRTATQQKSINNGRMAAISSRFATFNTAIKTTKAKATHTMAAMSSPSAVATRAMSKASYAAQTPKAVNYAAAAAASVQPPRLQITSPNNLRYSMNSIQSSLVAAIMRS